MNNYLNAEVTASVRAQSGQTVKRWEIDNASGVTFRNNVPTLYAYVTSQRRTRRVLVCELYADPECVRTATQADAMAALVAAGLKPSLAHDGMEWDAEVEGSHP